MYGFDQHIKVYETETTHGTGDHTGHDVKPHWRRGHWAHQPCGPKGQDRKLIFRPAVLVNSHLFGGKLSDTRVTMTTGGNA